MRSEESARKKARIPRQSQESYRGLRPSGLSTYSLEWERYILFSEGTVHDVPGRDMEWDADHLWRFLCERSKTCKPSTVISIMSALKSHGVHHGFLLPTAKGEQPSVLRWRIRNMRKQLHINYKGKSSGAEASVNTCVPLGNKSVAMMLSAHRVTDERTFLALPRQARHHLVASLLQHTAAMRFGHFVDRNYTVSDFKKAPVDGAYRLFTSWSRYTTKRKYCLIFPRHPKRAGKVYVVESQSGEELATLTAAEVLEWHLHQLNHPSASVFAPVPGVKPLRSARQTWLRTTWTAILGNAAAEDKKLVHKITPHSFRPGLATDQWRAKEPSLVIMAEGRWAWKKTMEMYATRIPLQVRRVSLGFTVVA